MLLPVTPLVSLLWALLLKGVPAAPGGGDTAAASCKHSNTSLELRHSHSTIQFHRHVVHLFCLTVDLHHRCCIACHCSHCSHACHLLQPCVSSERMHAEAEVPFNLCVSSDLRAHPQPFIRSPAGVSALPASAFTCRRC